MDIKKCPKCGETKPLDSFDLNKSRKDGRQTYCRPCKGLYDKSWAADNRDQLCQYQKAYRKENPEKRRETNSKYYEKNKDKIKEYVKNYRRHRLQSDPMLRLIASMRSRINSALKKQNHRKLSSYKESIGCSPDELKNHLENLFKDGMNWDNYGSVWHVDHIKPLSAFNLPTETEQQKANHYTNLQPMFAEENKIKSSNYYGTFSRHRE